jgi:uncharacterized protein (TIRG00374 family)
VGIGQIVGTIVKIKIQFGALAIILVFVGVVVSALKWYVLIQTKRHGIPFRRVFCVYYYGAFANLALPSSYGGDVVKGYLLTKETDDASDSYASIFVSRFVGLVVIISVGSVGVVASTFIDRIAIPKHIFLLSVLVCVSVLIVSGVFFSKRGKAITERLLRTRIISGLPLNLRSRFQNVYDSIHVYRSHAPILIVAAALSFVFFVLSVMAIYLAALAIGAPLPVLYLIVTMPVIQILLVAPISVNGYGVREGLYILFYTPIGLTGPEAVSLSITVSIIIFIAYSGGSVSLLFLE